MWNSNKFTSVAAWCSGDFNADGVVDISDFNVWNGNKFTASDASAVVFVNNNFAGGVATAMERAATAASGDLAVAEIAAEKFADLSGDTIATPRQNLLSWEPIAARDGNRQAEKEERAETHPIDQLFAEWSLS